MVNFIDRSSPNLERSFSVWCTNEDFLRPTLVAIVTKITISYNLAKNVALMTGLLRVALFNSLIKICKDRPPVSMVTKLGILTQN